MPRKISASTLTASTIDILNVIRTNASLAYQDQIPVVKDIHGVRQIGTIFQGNPSFQNEFVNALMNRIALVQVKSLIFNNPYKTLKKGEIMFGETIEETFIEIAKVDVYDVENAYRDEFKRVIPDVKAIFHIMNYKVKYKQTVQEQDLTKAFLSLEGVTEFISGINQAMVKAAEYDEYLMMKMLLIKAVTSGAMKPVSIGSGDDLKKAAVAFRGTSNQITFPSTEYNEQGVLTATPKDNQIIFMDSEFNAKYDVEVLASAFNMDKATFQGRLFLIDSFTTFDNKRFEAIRETSEFIPEVTSAELAIMKDVKAIMIDENWFQVYDNLTQYREKEVAGGLYWNYWLHIWKTYSHSPFANAVAFVTDTANVATPDTLTVEVVAKDSNDHVTVLTLGTPNTTSLIGDQVHFVQTEAATASGIAIQPYGVAMIPAGDTAGVLLEATLKGVTYTVAESGTTTQKNAATAKAADAVGKKYTLIKQ